MYDDTRGFDASTIAYKQQPPLNIPNFDFSSPISSPVPPQLNTAMDRSSSNPWSPAPLAPSQYDKLSNDRNNIMSPRFITTSYLPSNQEKSFTKARESTMASTDRLFSRPTETNAFNNQSFTKTYNYDGIPNKSFSRMNDTALSHNDSSSAKMIKSTDQEACCSEHCTPRCKLGILGFAIGLLIICVPLAVVLVLWLRG